MRGNAEHYGRAWIRKSQLLHFKGLNLSRGTNIGRIKRTVMPVALIQTRNKLLVPENMAFELDLDGVVWFVGWAALLITNAFFPFLLFPLCPSIPPSFLPPDFLIIMMLFSKLALTRAKPKVGVSSSGIKWCWLIGLKLD